MYTQQPMISLSSPNNYPPVDGQMSSVTLALRDLNKSLPPERQIKIIIFLYSKFSEKSDMLIKSLPQECRQFFYYICIDNKAIRNKITNSSTMKISEVPCVIIIDINDNISTYEGDRSVEIIKIIHNLNTKHQLSKHGPDCKCPVHNQTNKTSQQQPVRKNTTVTQISDLLGDEDQQEYPSESKRPPRRSPIPDKLPIPIDDEEEYMSDERNTKGVRRTKVRSVNRPIDDHARIPHQEPPEVGMSSSRNYPMKGVGHDSLAHSSLKQPSIQKKRNEPMQISGGEMLDDDEFDDEDDDQPVKSGHKPDKKAAMDSVKKAAMEMQKMRESEVDE